MASILDFLGLGSGFQGVQPGGLADMGGEGFMGALNNNRNAITGLGLGLMSGTKYNPYGNVMQGFAAGSHLDNERAKIAQSALTGDIKEYQYAKSQGFNGTLQDWQKEQANLRPGQYGNQLQWFQKPDGTWGAFQTNNQGEGREVTAPGGGKWSPSGGLRDYGTEFGPNRIQPYGPGGQQPGQPTTSTTDDAGRPVVPEGPAPIPGTIPKNTIGQKEQAAIGEGFGKEFTEIQKNAGAANRRLQTLKVMSQIEPNAYEGAAAPTLTYARSLASSFGIPVGKEAPAGEVFQSLSNRMVLDATGGSLGNQISNADRDFIASTVPNLAQTGPGRRQLMDISSRVAQREIETARLASAYRRQNGNMDGFQNYMADYAEKNPLFPEAQAPARAAPNGISPDDARKELERRRRNQT